MASKVFHLPWSRNKRLPDILERAGLAAVVRKGDFTAVKLHFGEKGNDGFVKPAFVKPVVKAIKALGANPFLTDTNTIYRGQRADAVSHLNLAAGHGFTQNSFGCPVIIADGLRGDSYVDIEVRKKHFQKVRIAEAIHKADAIVFISHFKGHLLCGFGGALKNAGMGCGARLGKFEMHSSVAPTVTEANCTGCGACEAACAHGAIHVIDGKVKLDTSVCVGCGECILACDYDALNITWNESAANVQERLAEYALGATAGRRCLYVNFLNHITENCDCMGKKEPPLIEDIGILASADPVAIDQASLDLVIEAAGRDLFREVHPSIDCTVQLAHAESIGLGTRSYELVTI